MRQILLLLILGLFLTSNSPIELEDSNKLSTLVFKVKYNSYGMTGFGGRLKIRHLETNEIFQNNSKKGFNPFLVIENLPNGIYKVEELEIFSGSNILTIKDENLFNVLELERPGNYYVGSYMTKKTPPISSLKFQVTKIDNDKEDVINKQLKDLSEKWLDLKIEYGTTLFKNDTTRIEI